MTTRTTVEARIALCIIRAQKSSDTGKGINRIFLSKKLARPCKMGYDFKEADIVEAIKLIRNNKTQFNYWVEFAPDQNGINSIIVYFDFRIDDKKYQVSFHNHNWNELESFVNTGRKTRWNKNSDCFKTCLKLQKYYDISRSDIEMSDDEITQRDPNRRSGNNRRRRKRRF